MASPRNKLSAIEKIYTNTIVLLWKNPKAYIPFLIFAGLEYIALVFIFIAPRAPFQAVFGPPIKTFWGETFLHYPFNFLLMPKLMALSRLVLSVFFGSLLVGMAVTVVSDIHNKKRLKLKNAFKEALKRYLMLFSLVLIVTILYYFIEKLLTGITANALIKFILAHKKLVALNLGTLVQSLLIALNLIIAIIIQALFIYTFPFIMIEKSKILPAILGSFKLFKKHLLRTILLVGLPILIYLPFIILNNNVSFLINSVSPEFVLLITALAVVVSSLVIDPLVTISITLAFLDLKQTK